jgi:hypothetical protein
MKPVPAHITAICQEFGVEIVPGHRYPDIGQTRAIETMNRIWKRYGEDHLRMVMRTLCETANNRACLDEVALWSASDLVRACAPIIEAQASEWLDFWDRCPVGELQFWTQDLRGLVPQRHALTGMIYERVVRRFGPRWQQPDLLDDRRRKT